MKNKYLEKIADLTEEEAKKAVTRGAIMGGIYGLIDQFFMPDHSRNYTRGVLVDAAEGAAGNLGLKYLQKEL